jgi:hypothetical protein
MYDQLPMLSRPRVQFIHAYVNQGDPDVEHDELLRR